MKQTRPTPDAIPTALHGLWSEACGWVSWLVSTFAAHPLATTGVKRTTAARLTIWLSNIEGAVRRLILAAALALAPPAPRQRAHAVARRVQPRAAPRNPSFRLLRLPGATAATAPRAPSHAPPTLYAHIRFPRDPLLHLGATRTQRAPALRIRNPLDRWVRPSRHDPDWRLSPNDGALMFSAPPEPQWRPPRATPPRAPHIPHDPNALPPSLIDWRRRHDEWQRLISAPTLATRLEALAGTIANPHALIARAARRLYRAHNLDPGLRTAAPSDRPPAAPRTSQPPAPHSTSTNAPIRPSSASTPADPAPPQSAKPAHRRDREPMPEPPLNPIPLDAMQHDTCTTRPSQPGTLQ